ncbi:MAG: aminotransferase class I/II-fold pyridoxal phosphate-dependent enzyme [Gemmatimonadota bacterium]
MRAFVPFAMERWQSTYENRVAFNLSESGVHPLTLRELASYGDDDVLATLLGYGQSNGSDPLRAYIAAMYDGADDGNVVLTNGSAEANFVTLWELLPPGGTVAVYMPTYMQTHHLAQNFGATVREFWGREEDGWQPDPDEVRSAIDGADLVVVTNPGNPTGAVLSDASRRAIVDAAASAGAWILADEVYAGAEVAGGPATPSFWGSYDRVVAVGSLSKAYGLPGLRIGWLEAPHELAARLWSRTDFTSISTGQLTDTLACIALRPDIRPKIMERARGIIRSNLQVMADWLDRMAVFTYRPPDAGAIVYARYDMPPESEELAERLRVEQDLLIVPGAHFAMGKYVRFGFGLPVEELQAALGRFGQLIGK